MPIIDWTDVYLTGIEPIDEQHQHLVEIVNKFEEAARKGRGSRMLNEILNDLIGYTQEHFAFEEKLMAEAGYPELKAHQRLHRQLLQKVERFQFDFNAAGERITSQMHEFLAYWLSSHMLEDDQPYGPYLRGEVETGETVPAGDDASPPETDT